MLRKVAQYFAWRICTLGKMGVFDRIDDSFGVMQFDFDLTLTQFYTRNLVKEESNRITPKESSQAVFLARTPKSSTYGQ